MRHLKNLFSLFAVSVVAGLLGSSAYGHEGKLIKLTGTVEVQLPGQPARPATLGMAIPQGAVIQTGADGQAFLETFNGGVAAIQKNTSVAVEKLDVVMQGGKIVTQEALLDLKHGNVVSTLDPTKKSINKYGVKTPKGVAAARGTVFSVTSDSITGDSVSALTGFVDILLEGGGVISLPVGGGEALYYPLGKGQPSQTLASAVAENPALKQDVVDAVQVVADNVKASTSAVGGNASGTEGASSDQKTTATNTATAIMTAVFKAAVQAVPTEVTTMTTAAISAVSSSGSQTSGSSVAVAAITEAAVAAVPGSVNEIAKAASNAVVQTKVAEAVAAAKANDPSASEATLAAVAQKASNDAQATVQVVAQTAVNTAVNAIPAGDGKAAAAQAIADGVKAAAADGSKTGGDTATNDAGVSNPTTSAPPAVTVPDTTNPTTNPPPSTEVTAPQTPIDVTARSGQ
jgi:hypothetical protein